MGLWARLFGKRAAASAVEASRQSAPQSVPPPEADNTVLLPMEPFVFECRACGKVFEARRKHPQCPECDSADVAVMSDD